MSSQFPGPLGGGSEAIRRRLDRAYVIVVPPDEIDAATSPALAERLRAVEENTDIVLDLRSVRFCDSSAIAMLLTAHREAAERDCTLTLSAPPPELERLLELCGLDDHFVIRRPVNRRSRRLGGADPAQR